MPAVNWSIFADSAVLISSSWQKKIASLRQSRACARNTHIRSAHGSQHYQFFIVTHSHFLIIVAAVDTPETLRLKLNRSWSELFAQRLICVVCESPGSC